MLYRTQCHKKLRFGTSISNFALTEAFPECFDVLFRPGQVDKRIPGSLNEVPLKTCLKAVSWIATIEYCRKFASSYTFDS
jgi:hypothetical protein